MNPRLQEIPDSLLTRRSGPRQDVARLRDLEQWCLAAGFRPSLWDVHTERKRRGIR